MGRPAPSHERDRSSGPRLRGDAFTRFLPPPSTVFRVKLGLATLAASVALVAAAPAHASTPMPWCGTTSSRVDRLPDATSGLRRPRGYVRPPSAPDRFAEFAPRIVGDAAAFDAWWRSPGRDAHTAVRPLPGPGCASSFGALDISNVQLPHGVGEHRQRLHDDPAAARRRHRLQRAREGLPRLLRRPDRPGRPGPTSAGRERRPGRLRPSRHRGRLPRLLRRRPGRHAATGRGDARARARLRRRRTGRPHACNERARLRLRQST